GGARPGLRARGIGADRPGLRPGDTGLCLCDAGLWPPVRGLLPVRLIRSALERRPAPRTTPDLPGGLPRSLRGRDRAPGRTRLGNPGFVPAGAVHPGPPASGSTRSFRPGSAAPDVAPLGLQPTRIRIALDNRLPK